MSSLRWLIGHLRLGEVIIMQGTPVLGLAFAAASHPATCLPAVILCAGSIALVASIWMLNDWADHEPDSVNPHRRTELGDPTALLVASRWLLAASIVLFAMLPARTFAMAATVATMGFLYSASGFRAKETPLASTVTHLLGASCHFLMGSSVFAPIDLRSVAMSTFFALTFAAGHGVQEVQDAESDRSAGIVTNAVAFGPVPVFLAACAAFGVAYLTLFALCWYGVAPAPVAGVALAVLPLHIASSRAAFSARLSYAAVRTLRTRYRILYSLIGLTMLWCWGSRANP